MLSACMQHLSHCQGLLLFMCTLVPVIHLCMSAVCIAAHCSASEPWSKQPDRSIGRVTVSLVHIAQLQNLGVNGLTGVLVVLLCQLRRSECSSP